MPAWVPLASVIVAAILLIVLLGDRVAPGWWLPGWAPKAAPGRKLSDKRTLAVWIAVLLAVVALLWILSSVFQTAPPA